eukprot:GFUD01097749.1.p1 GENE.GFUD01097749.1~~GFUD01097749.1.p1  ORF type:complete len:103 (+),score=20.60 GFUD01097749.1:25-309(+)
MLDNLPQRKVQEFLEQIEADKSLNWMLLIISSAPLLFTRVIIIYLTTPELKNKLITHNMINKLVKSDDEFSILKFMASQPSDFPTGPNFTATLA